MSEKIAADLADFLLFESQNNDNLSPLPSASTAASTARRQSDISRRHALDQLIESTMGAEVDKVCAAAEQGGLLGASLPQESAVFVGTTALNTTAVSVRVDTASAEKLDTLVN